MADFLFVIFSVYGPLNTEMAVLQLCHWKFSHNETLFDWSWLLFKKTK